MSQKCEITLHLFGEGGLTIGGTVVMRAKISIRGNTELYFIQNGSLMSSKIFP